jgi:hypothetical protein
VYWGVSGIATQLQSFTRRPRCSVLRELLDFIKVRRACQHQSSVSLEDHLSGLQQRKMSKDPNDSKIESRSSKLLIPWDLRLGM